MPIRANPAAAALLAGGVSLSALTILIIYLKLRSNPKNSHSVSDTSSPSLEEKESSVSNKQVDAEFDIAVKEPTEELLNLCKKEESLEDIIKSSPSVSAANSQAEAEAAEESISECEHQLDAEEEAEEVDEILEEEAIEPEIRQVEKFAAPQVVMATQAESLNQATNNNNDSKLADQNDDALVGATQTTLSIDCQNAYKMDSKAAAMDGGAVTQVNASGDGGERVTNWLAKNQRYCRISNGTNGGLHSHPSQHQNHAEEASDDSGRPSSVDTAADAATSPQASGGAAVASHQPSAAVAAAMSLSPQQQPQSPGASAFLDRSKVIRGVSPVPGDDNDVIHQFLIPNKLGGSMVGTRGRNINYIRAKSGASVWISRNFFDKKTQVVNVRGPVECVKAALQVIKKRFPDLDVKPINTAVPIQRNPALQPTMCQEIQKAVKGSGDVDEIAALLCTEAVYSE